MPLIVPPVPTPATKWVILPSVCAPDLGAGGLVVGARVVRVGVLVGLPGARLRGEPVADVVVGVRVLRGDGGRADDDLGAVRLEHVALVLADLVRADEDALVALGLGHHGQADAGVAGGRLDDGAAGLELAGRLRRLDHPGGDPVLHGAARVEVLDLRRAPAGRPPRRRRARAPASGRAAGAGCCRSGPGASSRTAHRQSSAPVSGSPQPRATLRRRSVRVAG